MSHRVIAALVVAYTLGFIAGRLPHTGGVLVRTAVTPQNEPAAKTPDPAPLAPRAPASDTPDRSPTITETPTWLSAPPVILRTESGKYVKLEFRPVPGTPRTRAHVFDATGRPLFTQSSQYGTIYLNRIPEFRVGNSLMLVTLTALDAEGREGPMSLPAEIRFESPRCQDNDPACGDIPESAAEPFHEEAPTY